MPEVVPYGDAKSATFLPKSVVNWERLVSFVLCISGDRLPSHKCVVSWRPLIAKIESKWLLKTA